MPKQPRKCKTRFCRGKPQTGRRRCEKCRKREWRKKNPILDRWYNLLSQARRRGIACTVTLEQFTAFCERTGYHLHSGRKSGKLSVDRIDNNGIYEIDNIQAITMLDNRLKYAYHDRLPRLEADPPAETLFEPPSEIDLPGREITYIPF